MKYIRLELSIDELNGLDTAIDYTAAKILDSIIESSISDPASLTFTDGLFMDLVNNIYRNDTGPVSNEQFVRTLVSESAPIGVQYNVGRVGEDAVYLYIQSIFANTFIEITRHGARELASKRNWAIHWAIRRVKSRDDGYQTIDGTTHEQLAESQILAPARTYLSACKKRLDSEAYYPRDIIETA